MESKCIEEFTYVNCSFILLWMWTRIGHTVILNLLKKNVPLSQMRSDRILPRYMFDKNYVVSISSKEDRMILSASQMGPDINFMAVLGQVSTIKQRT